jgi:predicted SAM-dependent methyltransferase
LSTAAEQGLKLHLGCGSTVVSGWENLDRSPGVLLARVPGLRRALRTVGVLSPEQAGALFPHGIVHTDVLRGLRYPTASASYVYSSHMIEHMARWQALELVRECARVLRPGGVLRFATPDLAVLIDDYVSGTTGDWQTRADAFVGRLGTFAERRAGRRAVILQRLFTAPHQWLYDAESLGLLLEEGGFGEISSREFRDSELPDIERLETESRAESLFVEARRP